MWLKLILWDLHTITLNENTNHDFVENCSCAIIHLVKLVNAANAIVTQHKGTPVDKEPLIFFFGGGGGIVICL